MNQTGLDNKNNALIKFVILVFIILLTYFIYDSFQLKEHFSLENIGSLINEVRGYSRDAGWPGIILFFVFGVMVIILNVPTAIIIGIASAVYGVLGAILLGFLLLNVATTCIFFIGRKLGREFVFKVFGRSVDRLEKHFQNRGMITVIHLRILFFAVPPMNWFLSVMNLSYRDYFWGTFWGGLPKTIIYAWIGGVICNALADGVTDLSEFTYQIFIPVLASISLSLSLKVFDHRFLTKQAAE